MLPSIAKFASKHGITPLKKYGQNFIFDQSLCDKIVRQSAINKDSHILEIGPGTAGLTRSILSIFPKKLSVIETDARCLPLLEEIKQYYSSLEIIHADALKTMLSDVRSTLPSTKLHIISNLPYNIGTKLLINWLYQIDNIQNMTLMLQKEVVDRIISLPNNKIYGRLSIICQLLCDVHKCFDVSPKAFYPEPKIWSSIVHLTPKTTRPSLKILTILEKITCHAFSNRRKMLKSSLKNIVPNIVDILDSNKINSNLRAENLSPDDYLRISISIKDTIE